MVVDGRSRLEAYSREDLAVIERLDIDQKVEVTIKTKRNIGFNRKAMRLIRDVFENQDTYDEFEDILVEFKLKSGHYREHITTKGVLIYVPKSIDFDNCEQAEFEELYKKWINIAADHFGYSRSWEYL